MTAPANLPRITCTFRTCRFCGAHRGQQHLITCNWHWIGNPIPDALYGTDDDWFNTDTWTGAVGGRGSGQP